MIKRILSLPAISVCSLFLLVFILLRIPSLIEPYWYGDEGIYAVIGQSLRNGALLYKDIWDNKPPLLYILYGLVNGNLFWIKGVSLLIGTATVVCFYYFSTKLFNNKRSIIVSTGLFSLLFGLPLLEGNIANAENFMLLPLILGALFAFYSLSKKGYFLAGIFLSIALMIKVVAVFDIAAILFVLFIRTGVSKKTITEGIRFFLIQDTYRSLFLGIMTLPVIIFIFSIISGSTADFFSSVFARNVDYVGANNHFVFPLGWVALKIIVLATSLYLIFHYRKKLFVQELLILTWMTFALFSMFFSERPYTHYVLMGIIPFSLLIGYLFEKFKWYLFCISTIIVIIIISFFPIYKKTFHYYENYSSYLLGKKSLYDYIGFFDKYAVRDYILADSIKGMTSENDSVYFWSDSAQLYILSEVQPITKYIVAYHVMMYERALEETVLELQTQSPKYIVSTTGYSIPRELLNGYTVKYIIEGAVVYEKSN